MPSARPDRPAAQPVTLTASLFEPLGSERTRAGASPLACQNRVLSRPDPSGICAAMSGCARREPWAAAVRSLFAIYSSQIWSPRPSAKLRVEQFGCEDLLDLPWPRGQALLVVVAQARFERLHGWPRCRRASAPSGRGGRPQSQRRVAASRRRQFVPRMRRLPAETTSDRGSIEGERTCRRHSPVRAGFLWPVGSTLAR